ncbi:hypothetical protein AAFF_G00021860, partial [Aldrovandia affinis]
NRILWQWWLFSLSSLLFLFFLSQHFTDHDTKFMLGGVSHLDYRHPIINIWKAALWEQCALCEPILPEFRTRSAGQDTMTSLPVPVTAS